MRSPRLPVIMSLNGLWKRTGGIILPTWRAANDNWYLAVEMNCIHASRNAECHVFFFLDCNFAPAFQIYLIVV